MSTEPMRAAPLACVPDAIPAEERPGHFELIRHLFGARLQAREELQDGMMFRFPPDALPLLARFLEGERRCCPFLSFTLEVPASEDQLRLSIKGPPGVRDFLLAELFV